MNTEPEEDIVSILTSPEDYAYHINQVASLSTASIRVLKKQVSLKAPYVIEKIPMRDCVRAEYKFGLAPFRILAGVLLTSLMLGIFFYLGFYWSSLEPGTTVKVGLLSLALIYGLKWAFMSKRHELIFHLNNGKTLSWKSRSGEFKLKQRAVDNVIQYFKISGDLVK
jgi:hypothetical protein